MDYKTLSIEPLFWDLYLEITIDGQSYWIRLNKTTKNVRKTVKRKPIKINTEQKIIIYCIRISQKETIFLLPIELLNIMSPQSTIGKNVLLIILQG
ncbi:Uncharacterised protein [Listeria grayi]|uniref:Uncharacterized protein n=1 Tax=Listeria grayi TaxID=1641 RepID=A0A378M9B5_LISGR|nr:Uncharacterised protein [Listeria grayi]